MSCLTDYKKFESNRFGTHPITNVGKGNLDQVY